MRPAVDTTAIVGFDRNHRGALDRSVRRNPARPRLPATVVGELLVRGAYRHEGQGAPGLAADLNKLNARVAAVFGGGVMANDREAAEMWGRLVGQGENTGRRPPTDDAGIAAVAIRHGLTVATSNTRDFAALVATVDPRAA